MRAAIYGRYSSENQRPESIEDQVSACRRLADRQGFSILEEHIYADQAKSGARRDREALAALLAASRHGQFKVVLVDDLSRLARDNFLMLSVLAELSFRGIRVVSVADGLDSDDEEATLGIQIRGIFNELQLRDLKKKTLRGQIGQKQRGFSVGDRAYGFRSVPVGTLRTDKQGRPRPEGYKMEIEPREAAVVLRIFEAYAEGVALTRIVRMLNENGVPGRRRTGKGWSPATVSRMLDNEKYIGHWVWNKTENRRDPKTGRRRRFQKSESEWVAHKDESLRIVPKDLWEAVRKRRQEVRRAWPGGPGRRGFSSQQGSRENLFPTHLLSGVMVCGVCEGSIALVSGKAGGYYGCLRAAKGACENRMLVRRRLAEEVIVGGVLERISRPEHVRCVLDRVEKEVGRQRSSAPEAIRRNESELAAEERRLANYLEFIGDGCNSRSLAKALRQTERRVENLREELRSLRSSGEKVLDPPPVEWIEERFGNLLRVLKRRRGRSALMLRPILGRVRLEPARDAAGKPHYLAISSIKTFALREKLPSGSDQRAA